VLVGAVMTGVIGLFIVVACAETLHAEGGTIEDARDAAAALAPLAGNFAATLFGAGLLGAALLAAAVLPLSTAYSVSEALGYEAGLDDSFAQARIFYVTFVVVVVVAMALVLVPGAPLVPILFLSQALNAVLLLPLLVLSYGIATDRFLMGDHVLSRAGRVATLAVVALVGGCLAALAALSIA
jgi:Mn2+/Fe2+ NRAMP family transporter